MKFLPVFLLFTASFPLSAGPVFTVEEINIIPGSFYIGEPVTIRISLNIRATEKDIPVVIGNDEWIRIQSIDQVRKNERVFIFIQVITFYPGKRILPTILIGDTEINTIELEPVGILSMEDHAFAGIRGEMLFPGTEIIILGVSIACSLIVALAIIFAYKVRPLFRWAGRKYRGIRCTLDRRKILRNLLSRYEALPSAAVYTTLLTELRRSLKDDLYISSASLTTPELVETFTSPSLHRLSDSFTKELPPLLIRGDAVRFGGRTVSASQVLTDIRTIETVSSLISKQRRSIKGTVS